jgi:sulfatase maturation enzyme AslB (radical SAM superfamily)
MIQKVMYKLPVYNFEINMGYSCNMRCKFCFEQNSGYGNIRATKEMLSYFADYMAYVKQKTGKDVTATIYGGEPFMHLDNLVYFIERLSPFASGVVVVSNGLGIHNYENEILYMRELLKGRLNISISYNFSLQDETRQCGTYDKVRNTIRYLSELGFAVNSPVVFTPKTIHRIGEVFDDFKQLRDECKTNRLTWNYFKDTTPIADVKFDILEKELIRIRPSVLESVDHFRYSMIGASRGDHRIDCLFAAVRAALTPDGCIYPGYDLCHDNEFTKELLRFGYVGDPFENLDAKREELLRVLPVNPPASCRRCKTQCRVIPWRTLKDDISQYNQMPHPERCQVIQFVGKYIPIREV